jgi:trimeric autotransporter adhesin
MALILKDRVKETSVTAGTGTLTLTGAVIGYQTFNSVIASGSKVYYAIQNTAIGFETEWEVGVGTFTATASLSRDTVLSSSNAGSLVNFSTDPELQVFITQPAEEAIYLNQATGLVEVGGNGTNTVAFTNINTTNLTANTVTLTAGTITTNAANGTDITNKTYVDGLFSTGITYHAPVLVESPTALIATYNQPGGAGNGVGATLTNSGANVALVIDGISVSNTARVLVYQQSNAVHNGVYTVTNAGAPDAPGPGAAWVLTRATDADTYGVGDPNKLGQGDAFFVQDGNTGAGETYILNTVGTITFGSTNLTFAQISSAQIYDAGTGLSLTNLTFSIANTAVTAAQYGDDGSVGQFTVNAQGQITNAANVSINASSISVGTLANARTTANSANGASTIVARDSNGSFTANVITATDVNATNVSATTGTFTNISGNGATVTNINASNITSGTINNAFTTGNSANSASTLVLRDANGSFGANIISASFSGDGSAITGINASSISSGTIANARTTADSANGASTIVSRDSGGNFSANTITANVAGSGSGLTNINASNITSGTIGNVYTTANSSNGASTIVLRDAGGAFAAGSITGTLFTGNGSAITDINASAITTGTLDNARTNATSANGASTLVVRDANGSFAGNVITGTTGTFTNITGNASALTDINASNVTSGTLSNARTTATSSNTANTIVLRGASGEFSAGAITADSISGNGANLSAINASNISSGTLGTARVSGSYTGITGVGTLTAGTWNANVIGNVYTTANSANGANTIVARDANGNFTANIVTATFAGNAASITDINASNITSGTISNARTTAASANGASTIVSRDSNGSFAANVITGTTGTFTNVSGNGIALTAINASNVTSGTLDNARTTANSANGASTIVQRGSSGEFTAGAITASSFTGSGTGISAINASNISSGTIDNARTTAASANGASTIVLRDSTGNFTANTGTFTSVSGNHTSGSWTASVIGAQYGGTGSANLAADNVILGNGASAVKVVAPGTSGNVLTSNGSSWVSQAAGGSGAGTINRTDFTATQGQTVFSVTYPVGLIDVYRNGVKLAVADFTATNGTSFTLATGANAGDIIQAEVFSALNLYQTITTDTFSGNGVQTVFTMSVAPSNPSSTLVAISGVVQAPSNYTVASTTLTFSDAPPSGSNNISVRYLGVPGTTAVGSISFGTTGLTPNTSTTGAVTVAGTLVAANGGTGLTSPGTAGNVLTSNGTAWVSSAASGGGGQFFGNAAIKTIAYNPNTIGENLTVTSGNNGYSAGPVTINSGFTVTLQNNAVWTIF